MPADNEWRPALRADVERAGSEILWDPVIARQINLGEVSRALVDRIDGTRGLTELIDEVGGTLPDCDRAIVEHTLRCLLLMLVIEGAGDETLARARALQSGQAKLELTALDEARFACQGSTACCRGYAYGPLGEGEVFRIEALDLAAAFPHIAAGADWKRTLEDAESRRKPAGIYLAYGEEGRCTFLLGDGRCGIHAHFGAEHKPLLCRLYPLGHHPTLDGWKIFDGGECASFSRSSRAGKRFLDDLDRIRGLLPGADEVDLLHPLVLVDERTPCDFGAVLKLQNALCELVAAHPGDATALVVAVGRQVERFVHALRTCPLAAGQPAAAIAAALAPPPPDPPAPEVWSPAVSEGMAAFVTITQALFRVGIDALPRVPQAHSYLGHAYTRQCLASLHAIMGLAVHRQEPSSDPLIAYYERALSIPLPDDVLAMWRVSLRQQFFGDRLIIDDRLRAGALRVVVIYVTAVMGAKLAAAAAGRAVADADDLDLGHTTAMRMLHREAVSQVMKEHEHLVWAVFAALPLLLTPDASAPNVATIT